MSYQSQDFSSFLIGQSQYYDCGSSLYNVLRSGNFSTEGSSQIIRAKRTAARLHKGVYRDIGEPFKNHPDNVVGGLILLEGVRNPDEISAGYLHDIREMHEKERYAECLAGFSSNTISMVNVITRKPEEAKDCYRLRIINSSPRVYRIKANDLRHNTSDLWLALLTGHLEKKKIGDKLMDIDSYGYHFQMECPKTWAEIEKNLGLYEKVKKDLSDYKQMFESGEFNPEALLSHHRSEEAVLQA
ncbi:MAG: hypothetical protein JW716_04720 [Candidatus Aenigmarchaeota archaeon]|nr:hypothetical protein [Candidatus Aenigmarchaeota archaeon]